MLVVDTNSLEHEIYISSRTMTGAFHVHHLLQATAAHSLTLLEGNQETRQSEDQKKRVKELLEKRIVVGIFPLLWRVW